MDLIRGSIRYPVTVIVGVFIAMLAGYVALTKVPVQLTPEIERPVITITTNWFGASPEEIEKEIIEEQEEFLKSVEGVLKMTSEATDGSGTVTMEFAVGTDITGALVKVTNRLNEVPDYPPNADRPIVTASGPFENVIAWFVVKGDSTVYVPHEERLIEDVVRPRLERVEGVAKVNAFGGLEEELHVNFDPEILASMGITINQLANALRTENRDISGGDFGEGKRRYIVRTISRFETIDQVRQTVITTRNGAPIYVGDVANVSLDHQKPIALVRHKGEPSIAFNVQRQVGSNVLHVTEHLLEEVEKVNRDVLKSRGLKVEPAYLVTGYIESSIDLVESNIYMGGLLVIASLFLFLRSTSSIMVIAMTIPISVITAFLAMLIFGRTINVVSLAGMAFAIGNVADSAIVVLENIFRHMQMGKDRWRAAYEGTKEVWGALFASTVTTIAVFLPVVFVAERAGQLFKDIAIAVCATILVSLVAAVTVIPSLSARILSSKTKFEREGKEGNWLEKFANSVASLVDYINADRIRRLSVIVGMVALSALLVVVLLPPAEYLPNGNQDFIFAFMLPPPGYNLDEMVRIGEHVESQSRPLWETPTEQAKSLPGGGVDNFFFVALPNQAFFGLSCSEEGRAAELLPVANGAIYSVPGAFGLATQFSLFGGGFAGTRSVQIDVTGPDLEKTLGIAGQVFMQVGTVLPGSNSRPIPALDLGNPEVRVIPDRVRAADAGYTAVQVGEAVNALVDGAVVSEFRHQGEEIDLVLEGQEHWTQHTQDVAHLPMATTRGDIITVGDIASVVQQQGPVQINHVERQRAISVETSLPDSIPLAEAVARIENQIITPLRQSGQIGGLYDITMSGTADDLSRLWNALLGDFHLAILLTYLLLAALFQSFTYPLVVMLTVPLGMLGGVLGLRFVQLFDSNLQLDVLTMLGFVILIGAVISSSILIVYHALDLMREGKSPREAVKESVRVRVRPIFMTAATSVFGQLPLVIMPGAGSELYRGLGAVVLGGIVVSTVFTLVLTPLVFAYAIELVQSVRVRFGLSPVPGMAPPDLGTETAE